MSTIRRVAIADTEIDRLTPLTKSTQADIGIAGLTGQANIELRGANLKEPKLLEEAERERHDCRDHGQSVGGDEPARNRAGHLQAGRFRFSTTSRASSPTCAVRSPTPSSNAKKFSEALGNNADGVDDFLASVTKLSEQLAGASDNLDSTLEAAEGLLKSVDKEKVAQIVDNVEKLSGNLSATSDRIDGVVARVDGRAVTHRSPNSPTAPARRWRRSTTSSAVSIPRRCARPSKTSIRRSTPPKDCSNPWTSEKVAQIVDNVEKLSGNLSATSDQIDGVVARVDGAVKSITEFSDGARQTLAKVDDILNGVDAETLRETIDNIEFGVQERETGRGGRLQGHRPNSASVPATSTRSFRTRMSLPIA